MQDEEIINRVINELHQLKIIEKMEVCFAELRRSEFAYVINDLNYNENMRTIKNYFAKLGIDLVGRFAEFKYLNMDACIERAKNYVKENFL
jgi:protoporphyrinogen oxidase